MINTPKHSKVAVIWIMNALLSLPAWAQSTATHCSFGPNPYGWYSRFSFEILKAAKISFYSDGLPNYDPKHPLVERPVTCIFTVDPFGDISHLRILHSSGVGSTDRKALALIRKAAPFEPIPTIHGPMVARFNTTTGVYVEPAQHVKTAKRAKQH